jgi:hypothetical protein
METRKAIVVTQRRVRTARVGGRRGLSQLDKLFEGISGFGGMGVEGFATMYGEVTPAGIQMMSDIFKKVTPVTSFGSHQRVFYDLGCGVGKIVVGMAILHPEIKARGIEIVPERIRQAGVATGRILVKGLAARIKFQNGSFLAPEVHLRDAAYIFVSNMCFSEEVQQQLGEKMERECSAGCVVVASKEFPFRADGPFRLLEMAPVPMSWSSDSKVRVYRRI